jgi:hypothetical protein
MEMTAVRWKKTHAVNNGVDFEAGPQAISLHQRTEPAQQSPPKHTLLGMEEAYTTGEYSNPTHWWVGMCVAKGNELLEKRAHKVRESKPGTVSANFSKLLIRDFQAAKHTCSSNTNTPYPERLVDGPESDVGARPQASVR